MRAILSFLVFLGLLVVYIPVHRNLWESRDQVRRGTVASYVLPSKFSRIFALGNRGVLADFLFLKTITFIGERIDTGHVQDEADWHFVEQSLDVITDLDPYFLDPYVFAEGVLTWDAGRIEQANRLLIKGIDHRSQDWQLPFYVGFNYFYFLKDYDRAAGYIMQAASLPGSPGYLSQLGARLAYYAGKSKTALLFLKQMIAENPDPRLKALLQTRLTALEGATLIEDARDLFVKDHGAAPDSLEQLVTSGYLDELPADPYGGRWVLLKNGRVFSTSKFAFRKNEKAENR